METHWDFWVEVCFTWTCFQHSKPKCRLGLDLSQNITPPRAPCGANNVLTAAPHPIVHFQNLPITNFTSSRCFTTVAHIFPSLLSLPSFCPAKQWWLLQSAISDRMPAALFPSVSGAATRGKSSHLLNGRFCQLSHYCNYWPLLSRCHGCPTRCHPMANSMSPSLSDERLSSRRG